MCQRQFTNCSTVAERVDGARVSTDVFVRWELTCHYQVYPAVIVFVFARFSSNNRVLATFIGRPFPEISRESGIIEDINRNWTNAFKKQIPLQTD
jgi:hypothetical protein